MTITSTVYNRILFVYSKDSRIICLSPGETTRGVELKSSGWRHTMTIDPALWLAAFMESDAATQSDMMDELNFGPSATQSTDKLN